MRVKPITLSVVLVLALCGATQPAELSSDAAPAEMPVEAAPEASAVASDVPESSDKAADAASKKAAPEADAPAEVAPRAAAVAVPAKGKPPTREFFVGVWAEEGKSCDTALDFKADGTLIGPFPRWELNEAGELTMVGNRQKIWLSVVDKNTMHSRRSPADPPRTLKRC